MVPPVRWYHLFSTWIFLLSVAYPIHKISTFPLNLLALIGCFEIIINPYKAHWIKNLYIIFLHLLAFLWIPYDLSLRVFQFAFIFGLIYLLFIAVIKESVPHIYFELWKEKHEKLEDFLRDRFNISL